MTPAELIARVEAVGGELAARGNRLRFRIPSEAQSLIHELKASKPEILRVLRQRAGDVCRLHGVDADFWERPDGGRVCGQCHPDPGFPDLRDIPKTPPTMPQGIKLISWRPVLQPVILTTYSIVMDVEKFIARTLEQLEAALQGNCWQAGNWTPRDLVERLEMCGVKVEIEENKAC